MRCDLIVDIRFSLGLDLHTIGMLRGNSYVYMKNLLALDSCGPLEPQSSFLVRMLVMHSINPSGQPYLPITWIAPLCNTF